MQFTIATISAILALTSFTEAAPRNVQRSQPLSLTAQLQLADT